MDSGATGESCVGKGRKIDKTRRIWSEREEEVLIQALKEASTEGWKSSNGFRPGYLGFLENRLKAAFPEANLRGNPHIYSKVHVWKKLYGALVGILTKSGVGWNDTKKTIEASTDVWESLIKADHNVRTLKHKRWIYYHDWTEIFGNDRAHGNKRDHFISTVQEVLAMTPDVPTNTRMTLEDLFDVDEGAAESMTVSVTPSSIPLSAGNKKGKKRKQQDDDDDVIVEAITTFAHMTKDTMKDLIKELKTEKHEDEEKLNLLQDRVVKAMETIHELTDEEKVTVTELLVDNHAKLSLFLRYKHPERLSLARRLLRGGPFSGF